MTQDITNTYNATLGAIIACFTMIFGDHWFLFILFMVLNVIDYITGVHKATILNLKSSERGWRGIRKKLFYWIMIFFAFMISTGFIEIGKSVQLNLEITTFLGWLVLASLSVNECRSIIENFVEAGYKVPAILIKGLEIADKMINEESEKIG